jgi:glyoxylase-like metal-dependent hydrolase (beta-lactamase superfamily II)
VDSGVQRAPLLKNLFEKAGLLPQDIDIVVETHGHPDHYGNVALFPNTVHIYYGFTYNGTIFNVNNLGTDPATKYYLTSDQNVEIIKTPGHTPQDITVLVKKVPGLGTVAVCGDVFQNKAELKDGSGFANNPTTLEASQTTVLCTADYIIPGHGGRLSTTTGRAAVKCP